ncbi:Tetratricopeptide repeat-containing protein [Colwellia chukchiensis]|uniref:Tetratricopeptide repeat-containing protein n=1 Tax=Colwellia chukchiensis TaxID=641665 RepID=A0A1H7HZ40_9GAMM|nr:sulfotransferase [Colwellia chukchiensis]SEK55566.1 Tetratricopeptide repeat-containing protein [Colwellia chukchiensis]
MTRTKMTSKTYSAEQMLGQAQQQIKHKQYPSAEKTCRALLGCYPDHQQAWQLLSQIQLMTKQPHQALQSINQLLQLNPDDIAIKLKKVKCLHVCAQVKQAKELALELYALAPKNPELAGILGACLSSLKLYQQARQLYIDMLARGHKSASLYYNIATIERFLGNISAAEAALNNAIALNPKDYEAIALRSDIITQKSDRNHIAQLEQLLVDGIAQPSDKVKINYALAKELEDIGQYQASFRYLKTGADTRRKYMQYDAERETQTITRVIDTFDQSWINNTAKGSSEQAPIFIIGLPRTGTTLVERILESHQQVTSAGELNNFATILVEQCQQLNSRLPVKSHDLVALSQQLNFDQLGQAYLESVAQLVPETDILIDKMPLNFLYAGLIHKAIPKAKIIHLRRHPIDTCYAIYKKLFKNSYAFSYNLTEIANYYIAYHQLMQHWHTIMPGVIYDIEYEQLVQDATKQTQQLLAFCQLPWQAQCLRFYDNKSASTTASAAQVRQPIYQHSVAKWRHYEQELAPLIHTLKAANIKL